MKAMVYEHKVNTTEELVLLIISTARLINKAIVLRRGSSVTIVTDYGLDGRGSILDRGRGFFL
jgi:hypothetical protein